MVERLVFVGALAVAVRVDLSVLSFCGMRRREMGYLRVKERAG